MLEISEWAFVVYTQILIFSLLAAVIFFVLYRKHKKKARAAKSSLNDELSANKLGLYFDMEIKSTHGKNDSIKQKSELTAEEKLDSVILEFRADLLDLENEFTEKEIDHPDYWQDLLSRYQKILKRHELLGQVESKLLSEHDEVHELFSNQQKEMDELLQEAEKLKSGDEEVTKLSGKLNKLANSHRELSGCVFVLEDENRFLRDQIASLLNNQE